MFSKACEYGIKAVIYIATQSLEGKRVKIGDVVEQSGSPEAFTGKILGTLTRCNIVRSHTGPYGGFEIEKERLTEIRLSQIVAAIDGDSIYNGCALGLNECSHTQPCPMHFQFVKIREELKTMLENTSIYELAMGLKSGKSILMRSDCEKKYLPHA